jgi:lysozyme
VDIALKIAAEAAKPFEGLKLNPYHDPVGFPTIGYGHLLSRKRWEDLSKYPSITLDQAYELLMQDMQKAQNAVNRLITVSLTANQEAALIDFTYNVGAGNLQLSTLRRRVNRGDFAGAAEQFEKWVYAAGVKLPGLVRRNKMRKQLFLS